MYLIELLLPLYDNQRRAFGQPAFDRVRDELTERFGGVTAFRRSPAEGLWKENAQDVSRDEIIIYEVMAEELERDWWAQYRAELERRFLQKELIIRAIRIEQL